MSQTVDLERMEKESRRMFAEDGLLYLFAGLLLLLASISLAVPELAILVGFSAFLIFPLEALRRRITYPRLGYARFSATPGTVRGILGFTAAVILILVLIAFAGGGRFQPYLPLAFSIIFALAFYFGVAMHGAQFRDWLIIAAALAGGLFTAWRYDDWHEGAAVLFAAIAVLLLITGLVMLVNFVRKYPLPQDTEAL